MRYMMLALALSGCASYAYLSPEEECAQSGMRLAGISTGVSQHSAYSWQTGQTVTAESESWFVNCRAPETEADRSCIKAFQNQMQPKIEYNSGYNTKRTFTGIGYLLWIVPGVVLKIHYDKELNAALNESRARSVNTSSCN